MGRRPAAVPRRPRGPGAHSYRAGSPFPTASRSVRAHRCARSVRLRRYRPTAQILASAEVFLGMAALGRWSGRKRRPLPTYRPGGWRRPRHVTSSGLRGRLALTVAVFEVHRRLGTCWCRGAPLHDCWSHRASRHWALAGSCWPRRRPWSAARGHARAPFPRLGPRTVRLASGSGRAGAAGRFTWPGSFRHPSSADACTPTNGAHQNLRWTRRATTIMNEGWRPEAPGLLFPDLSGTATGLGRLPRAVGHYRTIDSAGVATSGRESPRAKRSRAADLPLPA